MKKEMNSVTRALVESLEAAIEATSGVVRHYYREGDDCTELVEETTWPDWVAQAKHAISLARP